MNRTKIGWCDYTWNPVTGCKRGCEYCYAARIAASRLGDQKFHPTLHPDRLSKPSRRKIPTTVFVCSLADLFGLWVPSDWIEAVLDQVHRNLQHTFLFLTKNPNRYLEFSRLFPKNVWLGATCTKQPDFELAATIMTHLAAEGHLTFLSAEPLLGPLDPIGWTPNQIIIGAQTGPGAVLPEADWVQSLTDWAVDWLVPVFHKRSLLAVDRSFGRRELAWKVSP